jgi:hypothetical protein
MGKEEKRQWLGQRRGWREKTRIREYADLSFLTLHLFLIKTA